MVRSTTVEGNYWKKKKSIPQRWPSSRSDHRRHVIYTKNKTWKTEQRSEHEIQGSPAPGHKRLRDQVSHRSSWRPLSATVQGRLGILSNKIGTVPVPHTKRFLRRISLVSEGDFNQIFTANDRCTITSFARKEMKIEPSRWNQRPLEKVCGNNRALKRRRRQEQGFKREEKEFLDLIAASRRYPRYRPEDLSCLPNERA